MRYMYEVSPAAALASMTRIFGGKPVTDVEELEAELARHEGLVPWSDAERIRASGSLEQLAQDASWWVRMYSAATLRKAPELATESLQARFSADPDPLVRSMAPGPR
jgi:hypothetical protein